MLPKSDLVLLKRELPSLVDVTFEYYYWYCVIFWVQVGILRGRCVPIFVIAVFMIVLCVAALVLRLLKFMKARNVWKF
jgi:hypothetical protein